MPVVDISLDLSKLAALLLESVVYGMFLVFYFILLYIAFWSQKSKDLLPRRRYIIPIATLMLLVATAHLVIDFLRDVVALIPTEEGLVNDRFFKKLSHPYAILNWVLYGIQTLLGDAVLVWRCYVVCDKKWWILIPGGLILAVDIAVLGVVSHYLTFTVGSAFIHFTKPWMTSWITLTSFLQILYSGAIVYQIGRKFNGSKHSTAVIRAFVESSALYTLFALALLITFERASDADWVFIDMITPLVGVSFCLIIIQLHFQFGERVHQPSTLTTCAFKSRPAPAANNEFHSVVFERKRDEERSCLDSEHDQTMSSGSVPSGTTQLNGSTSSPVIAEADPIRSMV
ncbi:hypothetical protein AGABI1DRAFT_106122 [Agaricus bisporus var. burnettii JB137-S8]|uniref:THH1/TOM1/TOM3 domain-containing protein n=1 Tax=Agaricus bisporus var. burnettii (strain JB137-S8 / ATCC MYA-4627 / FGSC 10392) TaxID=597362 RepID=K5WW90_AGABU|nr:uncharacterized protein AGABI1DRAFT_106122 [Agaricus bisporus var. burnettii JB137-S8]EKM79736.1 hypothetical protein AGABI1DRAFT_106122 [Agaricus bisporus var. burnettii JB137-S8]